MRLIEFSCRANKFYIPDCPLNRWCSWYYCLIKVTTKNANEQINFLWSLNRIVVILWNVSTIVCRLSMMRNVYRHARTYIFHITGPGLYKAWWSTSLWEISTRYTYWQNYNGINNVCSPVLVMNIDRDFLCVVKSVLINYLIWLMQYTLHNMRLTT